MIVAPIKLVRYCTMASSCGGDNCNRVVQTQYMPCFIRSEGDLGDADVLERGIGTNIMCEDCYRNHLMAYNDVRNENEINVESFIAFMRSRNWVEVDKGRFQEHHLRYHLTNLTEILEEEEEN